VEPNVTARLLIAAILALVLSTSYSLLAQESVSPAPRQLKAEPSRSAVYDDSQWAPDRNVQFFAQDLKSQKKQMVAANMSLTDSEAEKFWPVYDRYAADLAKIYDTKLALVEEYSENYKTMNGDEAETYIRRRAAVEEDVMQLRLKYVPEFRKVLSGRQTALFFQIEWRLDLMINLQLAQAPMIDL
jgi:hypothetical protein